MIDVIMGLAISRTFERPQLVRNADGIAALLAASIPWSTTATGILAALYVIAVLPTLDAGSIRTARATPAIWLPLAFMGLGILGTLWADVPWRESFRGLESMAKLVVLALAMLHFLRSERPYWVAFAFLVSCVLLLGASLVPVVVTPLRPWLWGWDYGVPVKDYIAQSGEFLIAMFMALYLAADCLKADRRLAALGLMVLAILFLTSILYVRTGRTALVVLPVLLLLFGLRVFGWRGLAGAVIVGVVLALVAWLSSPYLRMRTTGVITEVQRYQTDNVQTPSGERVELWSKSLRIIAAAPVFGHGTGSIESEFRKVAVGTTGPSSMVTPNPHNQTLWAGIQFGVVGIAVLWAMWIAHLLLFKGGGFLAWFGLLVTIQTIVGSLFNSFMSDFTQGWTYVICVGAAGGAMLRALRPPPHGCSP